MHCEYLVFPEKITFLNILSYQMELKKVEYFLQFYLPFIMLNYCWNYKRSGYINNTFVGALCYTDDVTLLGPSIRGLNAMISLCEVFAKNVDITFNCKNCLYKIWSKTYWL